MKVQLPSTATRWLKFVAIPLVALVIGVAVAIASSPASLTRGQHALGTPLPPSSTPTSSSPVASVTDPGVLGKAAQLVAAGTQSLVGMTSDRAVGSADNGKTWTALVPPAKNSGIGLDPADPLHGYGITGGSTIQFTIDGGATWKSALARPPGGGPYQVLGISPFDGTVWFFAHQGKLLRTRDRSASWRDLALPALSNPVLIAGAGSKEFFLASGNRVFDLIDDGQDFKEQPALPGVVNVTALAVIGGGPASLAARAANGDLYILQGTTWLPVKGAPSGPIAGGANGVMLAGDGGAKIGSPGTVSYSVDAGSSWHQATGLPIDQSVEAIAGQPTSTTFFAYCYGGDIYVSADGGRIWSLLTRALRSRSG